jgi:hypothetical protein
MQLFLETPADLLLFLVFVTSNDPTAIFAPGECIYRHVEGLLCVCVGGDDKPVSRLRWSLQEG